MEKEILGEYNRQVQKQRKLLRRMLSNLITVFNDISLGGKQIKYFVDLSGHHLNFTRNKPQVRSYNDENWKKVRLAAKKANIKRGFNHSSILTGGRMTINFNIQGVDNFICVITALAEKYNLEYVPGENTAYSLEGSVIFFFNYQE